MAGTLPSLANYLRVDGTNKMIAALKLNEDFKLWKHRTYRLSLGNHAGTSLLGLNLADLYLATKLVTYNKDILSVPFQVYGVDGTQREVAKLVQNTNDPYFEISKAGDITLLANKLLSCGASFLRLPQNVNPSPYNSDVYWDGAAKQLWIYDGGVHRYVNFT